jgi:hypothetical protein
VGEDAYKGWLEGGIQSGFMRRAMLDTQRFGNGVNFGSQKVVTGPFYITAVNSSNFCLEQKGHEIKLCKKTGAKS